MGQLLDRFQASSGNHRGPACTVKRVAANLDPDEAADFEAAIASRDVTASAIARVMREDGHSISDQAIGRHRRGECACGRAS